MQLEIWHMPFMLQAISPWRSGTVH